MGPTRTVSIFESRAKRAAIKAGVFIRSVLKPILSLQISCDIFIDLRRNSRFIVCVKVNLKI